MKRLKSNDPKNKKQERKSFFFARTPTSKKKMFMWHNISNTKEFNLRAKESPLVSRSEEQIPSAGMAQKFFSGTNLMTRPRSITFDFKTRTRIVC